ncbi:hypothetical protein [Halosimplex sp. J119]
MDLDLRVERPDRPIRRTLVRGVEQLSSARAPADRTIRDSFIQRHTRFRSLDAFCEASPSEGNGLAAVLRLDAEERDRFVAASSEFHDWSELRRTARIEDAIDVATS